MAEAGEKQIFSAQTIEDLPQIAEAIIGMKSKVLLLTGELGAGKTALVKALCQCLGAEDDVSSPTFSLVNEYRDGSGHPIYHLDLYRLNTVDEAIQIGVEEYLHSGAWCFIEWPDLILPLISDVNVATIALDIREDDSRRIRILK
jgi:tRNA threonylcarbamoyladenosine biosynthesis protein TsaE